ncbi:g5866 [Coccomyxa viridis]|uniref:G5866 protein n=1 Tax=Coccomyxa viridis TaxID=1274662 RepID=A0ABP1G0L4_9CHLO
MHEFPSDYIVVTYFGSTIPYFVAPAGYPTDRILTILKINTGWKKAFLQDAKGRRVRNLRKPLVPEIPYSFNPGSDRGILGWGDPAKDVVVNVVGTDHQLCHFKDNVTYEKAFHRARGPNDAVQETIPKTLAHRQSAQRLICPQRNRNCSFGQKFLHSLKGSPGMGWRKPSQPQLLEKEALLYQHGMYC